MMVKSATCNFGGESNWTCSTIQWPKKRSITAARTELGLAEVHGHGWAWHQQYIEDKFCIPEQRERCVLRNKSVCVACTLYSFERVNKALVVGVQGVGTE